MPLPEGAQRVRSPTAALEPAGTERNRPVKAEASDAARLLDPTERRAADNGGAGSSISRPLLIVFLALIALFSIFALERRSPGLSTWKRATKCAAKISVSLPQLEMNESTLPEAPTQPAGALSVLVTGGAGFIGSHAALRLLELGYRVTVLDNLSRGNLGATRVLEEHAQLGQLSVIVADLEDTVLVERVLRHASVEVVMHFAAIAFVGESTADPQRYWNNITVNTLGLLRAMHKAGVKRIIYSSTCATYGNPEQMPLTEQTPTNPINPYGAAKLAAERSITDYANSPAAVKQNFSAVLLRYFNVFGADPHGRLGESPHRELANHGRISTACFDAALGVRDSLAIFGSNFETPDGTAVRDYIHVTDLVNAHVAALEHTTAGRVSLYNIGVGKGYSVKQFVDACLEVTGADIRVERKPRRPGDYAEVYSDPTKINTELKWKANFTDLKQALATAWKWRQRHPSGYSGWNRPEFVLNVETGTQGF